MHNLSFGSQVRSSVLRVVTSLGKIEKASFIASSTADGLASRRSDKHAEESSFNTGARFVFLIPKQGAYFHNRWRCKDFSYHLMPRPGFELTSIELHHDLLKDALTTELPCRG